MEQIEKMTSMPEVEVNELDANNVEEIEEINDETNEFDGAEALVNVSPTLDVDNKVENNINTVSSDTRNSSFDSLFDNLYSDVAGANNFINSLIEQKKNVGVNEAYIEEEKEKLEQTKKEFNEYMKVQRESIELEKQRIAEFEKNQKTRLANEQIAFNDEITATRKDLELAAVTNKNDLEKLQTERVDFDRYKTAEEEALKIANEKLEMERTEFEKMKEIELSKIEVEKNKNKLDRETFVRESQNTSERLRIANEELEQARQQFEKYKEVEKQKLELESNNLSQSCARFKELVIQFNSGFKDLPGQE